MYASGSAVAVVVASAAAAAAAAAALALLSFAATFLPCPEGAGLAGPPPEDKADLPEAAEADLEVTPLEAGGGMLSPGSPFLAGAEAVEDGVPSFLGGSRLRFLTDSKRIGKKT